MDCIYILYIPLTKKKFERYANMLIISKEMKNYQYIISLTGHDESILKQLCVGLGTIIHFFLQTWPGQ